MIDLTKRRADDQPVNPYDSANILSKGLFFWLNPFIRKGFTKDLELDDLYRAPEEDSSKDLGEKLKRQWDKELQRKKPNLARAICRAFGFWYLLSGLWVSVGECIIRPLQAISLGWLIRDANLYLSLDPGASAELVNTTYWNVFYDGLYVILFSVISLIATHPYVFCAQHTGMRVRVACCQLIYRHALKLSNAAIGQTTVGQMVNLLTNDVNRFDIALNYIQFLIIAPVQAIITLAILSTAYLGFYPTLAGASILLLYVPFQSLMGRWFGRLRQATATRTDERIRLMNEIIPAMRVIKMYTWEDPFAALVELARKNEVRLIRYTSVLRGINMALFFVASKLILFICFITFVLLGGVLDPVIVFVSITLFNAVRLLMTLFFPYGVAQLAETLISCNRLQEFLLLPKQEPSRRVDRGAPNLKSGESAKVECVNVCANWTIINKSFAVEPDDSGVVKSAPLPLPSKKQLNNSISNDNSPLMGSTSSASRQRLTGSTSKNSLFASSSNVHLAPHYKRIGPGPTIDTEQTAITALRGINYNVQAGELMIIVGRVGSGKSSVLLSVLGELPLAAGRMTIRGRISYASQEPWIFAGTVRENVLFGKEMDADRYQKVLSVCSLDRDIKLFPQGDSTIVGERGVSLSGGQRARINLARAVYYDADVYLLDDPLSAVDAVVAKHIFNECIAGFLKDKAVILATHQTQFVNKDTRVLFLQDGRQISCKSYSDNKDLQLFIGSNWEISEGSADNAPKNKDKSARKQHDNESPNDSSQHSSQSEDENGGSGSGTGGEGGPSPPLDADKLIAPEGEAIIKKQQAESASDTVGIATYWYYIRAGSPAFFVLVLALVNLGTQVLFNGTDFWLSYWTDTEQRKAQAAGTTNYPHVTLTDDLTLEQNATIYTILVAALFFLTLIRTTTFFVLCMRSSINLHNRLFRSVLRSPIKFFDYNPIGVLLNRVSRDMGIVDDLLPPTAFDTIEIFVNVLGILVTVAIIFPLSLLPSATLCTIVAVIRLFYMRTVRSIKSLEGVTRSPVFSHLAASLNGLATIRAFGVEPEFERKFDEYQDIHSSAWFLFVAASRWLGISLDWVSVGYIAVVTIVMTLTVGTITGAQLGLAISSALVLSGSFQWGVRQSTEMESQMTSVARIREYSQLPEEPARESEPDMKPQAEWPQRGAIQFKQVNLRYFEDEEPVLKQLDFSIRAGEKVGIVGRTGAGKSSIIAVLFRLTEPEGSILIDGVDTKSIGLHDLRKKLSIIPQEPILFNGPIRRNLDPFNEYTDRDMWKALEQAKLADAVRSLPGALDAELNEGGSNFSVGERQLVCLARAILRQNRIIILDEATANVDPHTDKSIQRTITESFTDCTRLTIAHRLNTIMDSDRVLVMDAGQVREFDEPHLLLQNGSGYFSTMVKNTGKNASRLKRIARNCHEKRHAKQQPVAAAYDEDSKQQQQQQQQQ